MQCMMCTGMTRRNLTTVDASSDGGGKAWLVGCGPGDVELLTVSSLLTLARYTFVLESQLSVGLHHTLLLCPCAVINQDPGNVTWQA